MASFGLCPSCGLTVDVLHKVEVRISAVSCCKVNNPALNTPSLSPRKVFAMCWMFKPFPLCQFDPLRLAVLQKGESLCLSLLLPAGYQRRWVHSSAYVAHLARAEARSAVPVCPQPAAAMAKCWHSQAGVPARKGSQAVTSSRKSSWCFSVETTGWSAAMLAMKSSFLGMCWSPWGSGGCRCLFQWIITLKSGLEKIYNFLKHFLINIFLCDVWLCPLWTLHSSAWQDSGEWLC